MITYDDIREAYRRVSGVVHHTPVLTSRQLNTIAENTLFFKCENFQRGGAFKIRGAYNKIASLDAEQLRRGVVAFSSGNHAQGVALAACLLGTHAKIVMPDIAPKIKVDGTRAYGGEIVFYDFEKEDREAIGRQIAASEGRAVIPPFNDEYIMAGQGTIGIEIAKDVAELDYAFFPVGGGGLISGNAVSLKHHFPNIRVIGVETESANDVYQSFHSGTIVRIRPPKTLADGMRTVAAGDKTFEVIRALVDDMLLVSDTEVVDAMRLLYARLKIVVEPTGAVPFAAVLKNQKNLRHKKIAVVLSGGNIDLQPFFDHLQQSAVVS